MIELARRLILGAAVACTAGAALPGCTHRGTSPPPVIEPTPPPPATEPDGRPDHVVYPHLLLRTHEGRFVLTEAHTPFVMRGAIFCWPPDHADGTPASEIRSLAEGKSFPYMWTLISPELMAYARRAGAANTFMVRLGPYRSDKQCCGMQEIGGPLLPDGSFNPKFDAYLVGLAHDAGRNESLLGVSLVDWGWGGKHQCRGEDVGYALPGACDPVMGPEYKRFVEHYVTLLDPFANVFFEIGNENDLHMNWRPEFERENYALIRATERLVVHVVVSNTKDYGGPYEAMASHAKGGVDSPVNGKPVMVNEYNPAMSPAEFASCFKEMKDRGGACWYWRSDGTDEAMEASLAVLKSGGDVGGTGPIDYPQPSAGPVPPLDKLDFKSDYSRGSRDWTPIIRDWPFCNSIGMGYMGTGPGATPRGWCPLRNECGPTGKPVPGDPASFECDQRLKWEQWALKYPHPVCESDGVLTYLDSGFRTTTTGTWTRCCDATKTHCAEAREQ